MGTNLNLKTIFEADTRDLTKGAQQAKNDLKDFGKTSDEVFSKMGDALGVDTGKLEQMSNTAREVGRQLSESGNAGVAAFGKMLSSINAAQVAIAGLGIGAAITAFKALTAEAENFKNTVAGANIELQTAAYVSTYKQTLHDLNAATGQSVAEFEAQWKKGLGRFTANLQQSIVNGVSGKTNLGEALLGPIVGGAIWGSGKEQRAQAKANAEEAERITGEIYTLTRQLKAESVEWARTEAQIAEYRRIAKDDSYTIAQQQDAIAKAQALIEQRYGKEYEIKSNLASLQKELSDLASNSIADEDQLFQLQIDSENVLRNKEQMIKSLNRDQKTLTAQAQKEAEARRAAAEAAAAQAAKMAALRAGVSGTNLAVSEGAAAGIMGKATTMEIGAIIRPKYDPKEITDISKEVASLVEQGVASVSESIGSLIGDLATGGDAWHNFANNALSAFGDMAVSVGKMAIATGTATLGIKAALESLNGYVAIAAGAALVALGAAVKSGLGNIASGNYSASSSVASPAFGTVGSVGGGYATSTIKVEVSGKLTAKGSDLEYVFEENKKRRNTVT